MNKLPLLRLGFRPFYIGAALFAVLSIALWILVIRGGLPWPASTGPLAPVAWHGHEMVFGFASAVIIGFLFTAAKNWTQLQTPRGAGLGALVLLWAAARIAALTGPYALYFLLDVALLPLVVGVLIRLLFKAGNTRNLPLAALLLVLATLNLVFHLSVLGVLHIAPVQALHGALAVIVMVECIMAGRVIPNFTMSATPGLKIAPSPRLEIAALVTTVLALTAWAVQAPAWLAAPALLAAAALHGYRQWRWCPWQTFARPILWVLHGAYAWIAVGLALLAVSVMGQVSTSAGIHALAVGATGGLIMGMMTRTARGHTGRTLQASAPEVGAYVLISVAAVVRVFVPLLAPSTYTWALTVSAVAWCLAFTLYLAVYTPWLLQARLDGKDG
jgi:uncharacterized protein involved in response to NO